MQSMLITLLGLFIGIGMMAAGIYYLLKEKPDREAGKVYRGFVLAGGVVTLAVVLAIWAA